MPALRRRADEDSGTADGERDPGAVRTASRPDSAPFWRRIALTLFAIATIAYLWDSSREYMHGGSRLGLIYGAIAAGLILLLASFGIRKRTYRSTFGTLEQWLKSHVYLGVLVLAIALYHAGGHFHDHVAVTSLILLAIVVGSGIFGAALYTIVPRLLTEVESEAAVEEISDQLNQLGKQMARIASSKSPAFQKACSDLLEASRPAALAGWRLLLSRRPAPLRNTDLATLLPLVPKSEEEELRQLVVVSRQRGELLIRLMRQQRYKNLLEVWLYVHVPVTIALLLFVAVHVFSVFYFGSVRW